VQLSEYEAKQLLGQAGVALPRGALYPGTPFAPSVEHPLIAKAQLLEGSRGKRGGVLFCRSPDELEDVVARLRRGSGELPPAEHVLCEEMLTGERELYVAIAVDRDHGVPVLLAGAQGGVDVESMARPQRIELSILDAELTDDVLDRTATALEVEDAGPLGALLGALWACFRHNECLLLEINPCLLLADGRLVALDAKAELDDNATGQAIVAQLDTKTPFEATCAAAGVNATELDGTVAIVTSGAGLAMATLDMVVSHGGAARCVVDLGYSTLQTKEVLERVVRSVHDLKPSVLLVNAFLQMASCKVLAESVASVLAEAQPSLPAVARLVGNDSEGVDALLEAAGTTIALDLEGACEAAVSLAAGR
jgi:succinyl-CoA synthetase beta subunit